MEMSYDDLLKEGSNSFSKKKKKNPFQNWGKFPSQKVVAELTENFSVFSDFLGGQIIDSRESTVIKGLLDPESSACFE